MKINIHIIKGFNQNSIGLATYLQQRNEVVYICDDYAKGVHKNKLHFCRSTICRINRPNHI